MAAPSIVGKKGRPPPGYGTGITEPDVRARSSTAFCSENRMGTLGGTTAQGALWVLDHLRMPGVPLVASLGFKVLAKQFGDSLCQIVGDAQVLTEKANFPLDAAI